MRVLALLLAGVSAASAAQQGLPAVSIPIKAFLHDDGKPFVVTLPSMIPAESCQVDAGQTLANGTRHQTSHRPLNRHTIEIATGRDARALKAVVWCRGYRVQLIDVPALEASGYQTTLAPLPLRTLKVTGRIQHDPDVNLAGRELEAIHAASWTSSLSSCSECFYSFRTIATARIGSDGSFVLELPDLASDPVARDLRMVTSFRLIIRSSVPGVNSLPLEPEINIAAAYPVPLVVTLIKK